MKKDTFLIEGIDSSGTLHGVRRRDGKETPAMAMAIREGRPLMPGSELMEARRRPGTRELELRPMEDVTERRSGKGPAKVSSREYRSNFTKVFGKSNKDLN